MIKKKKKKNKQRVNATFGYAPTRKPMAAIIPAKHNKQTK